MAEFIPSGEVLDAKNRQGSFVPSGELIGAGSSKAEDTGAVTGRISAPGMRSRPSSAGFWTDVLTARLPGAIGGIPGQTAENITNLAGAATGMAVLGAENLVNAVPRALGMRGAIPKVSFADYLPRGDYRLPYNTTDVTERTRRLLGLPEGGVPPEDEVQRLLGDLTVNLGANVALGGPKAITSLPGAVRSITSSLGQTAGTEVGHALVPDPAKFPMLNSALQGLPAIGGAVGGMSPSFSPLQIAGRMAGKAAGEITTPQALIDRAKKDPRVQKQLQDAVARAVAAELKNDPGSIRANLDFADQLRKEIPGIKLDIGQLTGSQALINEARRLASGSPQRQQEKVNQDRAALQLLREHFVGKEDATGKAEQVISGVVARNELQATAKESAAASNKTFASDIALDIASRGEGRLQDVGAQIRKGREDVAATLRPQTKQKYDAAEMLAAELDATYDLVPVFKQANVVLSNPKAQFNPDNIPRITEFINDYKKSLMPGKESFSFDENFNIVTKPGERPTTDFAVASGLRQALNQDLSMARRATDEAGATRLYLLRGLSSALDKVIESGDKDVAGLYKDANAFFSGTVVPRTRTGPQLEMTRRTTANEFKIPDDKLFDAFFARGRSMPTERFIAMASDRPETLNALANGVMMKYATEVIKDTKIDLGAHQRFLGGKYGSAIDVLDKAGLGLRDKLRNPAEAYKAAMENAAANEAAAKAARSESAIAMMRNEFGPQDPRKVAEDMLTKRGAMQAGLAKMRRQEAAEFVPFISQVIADRLSEHVAGTDVMAISPRLVKKFLDSPQMRTEKAAYHSALTRAYGSETAAMQVRTLEHIAKAAEVIGRTRLTESELNAFKDAKLGEGFRHEFGFTPTSLWAALRTMHRIQSPEYIAAVFGGQAAWTQFRNMQDTVMRAAFDDSNLAYNLRVVLDSPTASVSAQSAASKVFAKVPSATSALIKIMEPTEMLGRQAATIVRPEDEARRQSEKEVYVPSWKRQ